MLEGEHLLRTGLMERTGAQQLHDQPPGRCPFSWQDPFSQKHCAAPQRVIIAIDPRANAATLTLWKTIGSAGNAQASVDGPLLQDGRGYYNLLADPRYHF